MTSGRTPIPSLPHVVFSYGAQPPPYTHTHTHTHAIAKAPVDGSRPIPAPQCSEASYPHARIEGNITRGERGPRRAQGGHVSPLLAPGGGWGGSDGRGDWLLVARVGRLSFLDEPALGDEPDIPNHAPPNHPHTPCWLFLPGVPLTPYQPSKNLL